ncbi:MAG: flagellar hook-basal body complex protein [Burkholderiaceae bacterium]|jgi:flagellar basal-body rod protein FlgF|nr:flagellar hook-basal body complex protein [Burkholderiaceae bacterium]
MDRLAFTAAAGINEKAIARQIMTNELANVSTVGFKRSFDVALKSLKVEGEGFDTRFQPQAVPTERVLMTPGQMMATGRKTDIAMEGATILGVQAPNGDIAFTRRGDLRPDALGTLTNGAGHIAMGEGGPIVVPPGFAIHVSRDGGVYASDPQQAGAAQPVLVGQLMLRDATEVVLNRREDGLLQPVEGPGDFPGGPNVAVIPETLEGSNVSAIEVMTRLIDHSRSFEANMKVIKEAKNLDESGASMMRAS